MLRSLALGTFSALLVCGCGGNSGTNAVGGGGGAPSGSGGTSSSNGGATSTGGASSSGGATSTGGASSSGGTTSTGGATSTGGTSSGACGTITQNPFTSCKFAWGAPSNTTNPSLNFVSTWVGSETNGGLSSMSATATNVQCSGCNLARTYASTDRLVVFYAYFIGFDGHAAGLPDCNRGGPPNLCTDATLWIRNNRAILINQYAQYAKAVYAASPNKPVIWWLEGDFVQYTYAQQKQAFSYAELGQLARDITCAIKSNEPNAVVAMNHSPWIANDIATSFWSAMPMDVIDLVWVQGPGDKDTFINPTDPPTYNLQTSSYSWLHQKTGRKIMAETSFANTGQNDRWTTATAAEINQRIASGVIGVHVNSPSGTYQQSIDSLNPSLGSTCN